MAPRWNRENACATHAATRIAAASTLLRILVVRRTFLRAALCLAVLVRPAPAAADVLLTPFAGVSFLDEGAEKLTYGAALSFGGLLGVEGELARTGLGELEVGGTFVDLEANLTTAMVNLVARLPAGPVQPYLTAGVGVIRISGDVTVPFLGTLLSLSGQDFGANAGGGVYVFPSQNLGIRADVRYFRTVGSLSLDELTDIRGLDDLPVPDLDFWRATAGVTLRF